MINFLNDIRNAENPISNNRKLINTIAILFLGIALGTFSKYLDFRQTELPGVLMAINGVLDIGNFLGRFAIWILIALCISIYSNSAIRASINVFVFFVGMVASYYLYSNYMVEASNPVPTPLLGHRCRSSQEITGSPTPFSTSNHYLWICESASFSLSNPNIAA